MGWFRKQRDPLESTEVIDLRDPVPPGHRWGSPLPCPDCDGRGYLDHIDPFRDLMYMHCTGCQLRYVVAKEDLDAARA